MPLSVGQEITLRHAGRWIGWIEGEVRCPPQLAFGIHVQIHLAEPPEKIEAILGVFPPDVRVERKTSGGGKYISLTIHEVVSNADVVFDRYQTVQAIGGIFAL